MHIKKYLLLLSLLGLTPFIRRRGPLPKPPTEYTQEYYLLQSLPLEKKEGSKISIPKRGFKVAVGFALLLATIALISIIITYHWKDPDSSHVEPRDHPTKEKRRSYPHTVLTHTRPQATSKEESVSSLQKETPPPTAKKTSIHSLEGETPHANATSSPPPKKEQTLSISGVSRFIIKFFFGN